MDEMTFKVKLEAFEGPLDLLLGLIEKRKLSISQVSLSKVADDFIQHMQALNNYPIRESADFILLASTLVLIKSKSLLPNLSLTEEETASIEDLEERLLFYQKIKESSKSIREMWAKNMLFYSPPSPYTPLFSPHKSITLTGLILSAQDLLRALPKAEKLTRATVAKVISLEQMMERLSNRISQSLRMSFKDFSNFGKTEKVNVIVSFLAMLELVKRGAIRVAQDSDFNDISIETSVPLETPKYI